MAERKKEFKEIEHKGKKVKAFKYEGDTLFVKGEDNASN